MHQLASKVKVLPKVFTSIAIAVVIVLILGGLGYRSYEQQQTLATLEQQIQSLISPEKRVELEIDRSTLKNTLFGTLVQTVGGLFLFITAYVSYQNLKATQKNVVVAEEKQVTERFTQAINQLGNEKIEVRLGGIYALERIAKDSPKDHWTIMEVLTAFVRERSKLPKGNSKQTLLTDSLPQSEPSEDNAQPKIAADEQAALTVIGRRDLKKEKLNQHINLSQAYLSGANLSGANLRFADLRFADLRFADLRFANLSGASLINANLESADLRFADLSGANLERVNLSKANLSKANLSHADLFYARLRYAVLCDAYLSHADLSCANLSGTNLRVADLSHADLSGANLSDADLDDADLSKTTLINANLSKATLIKATLIDANLESADLSGAYFIDADLSGAVLTHAYLINTYLREAKNWTETQLAAAKLCKTRLPGCNLNPNRDCEALGISLDPPALDSLK